MNFSRVKDRGLLSKSYPASFRSRVFNFPLLNYGLVLNIFLKFYLITELAV